MHKLLVIGFDSEDQADQGIKAIAALHAEGSITLYRQAVIAKDENGNAAVKQSLPSSDQDSGGSTERLVTGSVKGAPEEPVGIMALSDRLREIKTQLQPGKVAVVVEVEEETATPVDRRMVPLGGTVYRHALPEAVNTRIERQVAAARTRLEELEGEYGRASEERKANVQTRIEAARAELRRIRDRARAQLEAAQREVDAKFAELNEQARDARPEKKQELEERVAEVQADHEARTRKLQQASQLARQALDPTRRNVGQSMGADTADGLPLIERVYEGMAVVDAEGKWVGEVELVRMGDPEALTTQGQYRDAVTVDGRWYAEGEPDVPRGLRESLLRIGYIKVRRDGVAGIGKANHYARADEIADVSGDRVLLSVPEAKLVDSRGEPGPIIQ